MDAESSYYPVAQLCDLGLKRWDVRNGNAMLCSAAAHGLDKLTETGPEIQTYLGSLPLCLDVPTLPRGWMGAEKVHVAVCNQIVPGVAEVRLNSKLHKALVRKF
jgi:hypothetical protein